MTAGLIVSITACGDTTPEPEGMSADAFYDAMQVGDFADMSDEGLDDVAQGLCEDLDNLDEDQGRLAVLVVRQSTDTEQEAFEAGQAMTSRWCPEHVELFDY